MRIAVFSTKPYDEEFLLSANTEAGAPHELEFHRAHLSEKSAALAQGSDAICAFVNDCERGHEYDTFNFHPGS